jgi:hypothetical protein
METKTLVVIIAGLFILVLIILIIFSWYGKGIPVIDIVVDYLKKALEGSSWLTGNTTDWPSWA